MRSTFTFATSALILISIAGAAGAAELPHGFRLEPIVSGLTEPSALAGTDDHRILIAERTTGSLRQVRMGQLHAAPLCSVGVQSSGEGGLLGVAVHPDYRINGWIYLYYTDFASGNNKVTRFTVQGNDCFGAFDVLPDLGAGSLFTRNGGGMAFGPDGKLYVATGDMEDPSNGQTPSVLQAKILRIEGDGSIPSDNPDAGSAVYAIGVRDGRGMTVTPAGEVFVTDAGSDVESAHDELHWVQPNGDLGWNDWTGTGGTSDEPLLAWLPTIGSHAVVDYRGQLFPDQNSDGVDNDHDKWGADEFPGIKRTDDNGGVGVCIGSVDNGLPCGPGLNDCLPLRTGEGFEYCETRDDAGEWCPGGLASGDDDCDDTGAIGVDEPDESFLSNVFVASDDAIVRGVLDPDDSTALSTSSAFLDSSVLPDCPSGWTGLMAGDDGNLYAVATNGGGAAGALYRVVHDTHIGPREVSGAGSYFPLRIDKGPNPSRYVVHWEDLRQDSMQPRNSGGANPIPIAPVREYTIWAGQIGNWTSHAPMAGNNATPGDVVNDAYRSKLVQVNPADNLYFLVSGRGANLEGTLGYDSNSNERVGYATTDLCTTIGLHQFPTWLDFTCAQNITLLNEHDEVVSLHDFREKVVVLDFSAIWCAPCYIEADNIEDLWLDYKDRDVQLITILMDEESLSTDWNGRPKAAECRLWEDRVPLCIGGFCTVGSASCTVHAQCPSPADHTFTCWADPLSCTPVDAACTGGYTQHAWPRFNSHNALPTNVILDHGLRVAFTDSGWGGAVESTIRGRLNSLVGLTDTCLH